MSYETLTTRLDEKYMMMVGKFITSWLNFDKDVASYHHYK